MTAEPGRPVAEPAYLYGYGSKKHIAKPEHASPTSFCGSNGRTEAEMEHDMVMWNGPIHAGRYIARRKARPVCKLCEKAWDKHLEASRG